MKSNFYCQHNLMKLKPSYYSHMSCVAEPIEGAVLKPNTHSTGVCSVNAASCLVTPKLCLSVSCALCHPKQVWNRQITVDALRLTRLLVFQLPRRGLKLLAMWYRQHLWKEDHGQLLIRSSCGEGELWGGEPGQTQIRP